jgi:hypothetical protein
MKKTKGKKKIIRKFTYKLQKRTSSALSTNEVHSKKRTNHQYIYGEARSSSLGSTDKRCSTEHVTISMPPEALIDSVET